jgi:multiple sugar transport system substrate-binding protein
MNKKLFALLSTVAVLMAFFVACGTPPTPAAPVIQTVVVKEVQTSAPVIQTVTVKETVQVMAPTPTAVATDVPAPDKVQIYWYIGLGAGAQPAQIPLEKEWVEKYNASQDRIQVIPVIVDNKYARDNLTAQLAAGNAPDIVGPVGTAGRAAFPGQFLDLEPLIEEFKYDISDIDPAFTNFYKVEGALVGLPFAIFPSAVYVNKDLFTEAGLALPPQKLGEKYKFPDGTEAEWNFDTVAKLARLLTVDANGNDATSADFDPENIVQWGYNWQWNDDPRAFATYWCAHYPVKDNKADIPECWKEAIKFYYDAIWGTQPFSPNQAAIDSDLLKGNPFSSGKIAMGETHLWYTCCIDKTNVPNWDVAVVPSYNGKTTSKMHGDTFAIMKDSKHPKEAFEVYTYMLGEGSADLYTIYGGLPARKSQQTAFFENLDKNFAPNKANWQVFLDMIPFLDAPNHELGLPNNSKANDAFTKLGTDLRSNATLDVDKRIEEFIAELNQIYGEQPGSSSSN